MSEDNIYIKHNNSAVGSSIFIKYNWEPSSPVIYNFPKEYKYNTDIILDIISYYVGWKKSNLKAVETDEFGFGQKLYKAFNSKYLIDLTDDLGMYKFFLLDKNMMFNYFIKEWKKFEGKYENESITRIEADYDNLHKLAMIKEII